MTRHLLDLLRTAIGLLLPALAAAHQPSDAYVQIGVSGEAVSQRIDIALRDLDRDLTLDTDDDGQLQWQEVHRRWSDIEALARNGLILRADGQACEATAASGPALDTHGDSRYAVVTLTWHCATNVRALDADYRLFASSDPTHRGIVRWQQAGGAEGQAVLAPGAGPRSLFDGDTPGLGAMGLFREGIHHILIGADHVLFLLTLLLPAVLVRRSPGWAGAPAWRPVALDALKVVTAFTLAHSITLGLAVFGVLDPPSRWVEALIAASVVLAAINNLVPVVDRGRWKLTFVFGLVHGFGFAGALKAIGLADGTLAVSLLAFNVGVEVGQLAIVALFLPAAWALRNTVFYRRGLFPAGSCAVALLAALWFTERAFDLQILPAS